MLCPRSSSCPRASARVQPAVQLLVGRPGGQKYSACTLMLHCCTSTCSADAMAVSVAAATANAAQLVDCEAATPAPTHAKLKAYAHLHRQTEIGVDGHTATAPKGSCLQHVCMVLLQRPNGATTPVPSRPKEQCHLAAIIWSPVRPWVRSRIVGRFGGA
ncbi:hypothetical protein COO60DRAFT_1507493 [Scenedesmus sp. NREL 46B-D3]|nr:hypothetical protein COO60DRAFT_1507493 [Scenedesmus sp. NREL 46B-D3]